MSTREAAQQAPDVVADDTPPESTLRSDLGMLLVSAAILNHEVLETKIFSYSLDAISIYLAISVCLLGLGASATVLAVVSVPPALVRRIAALAAGGGAVCVLLAHVVFSRLAPAFAGDTLIASSGVGGRTSVALVALMLPYLCFGVVVALLMQARSHQVVRTYSFNLAGSALGCLIVFPVLDAVGAERALVVISALSLGAALLFAPPRPVWWLGLGTVGVGLAVFWAYAQSILVFPPEPLGQLNVLNVKAAELEAESPGERVEIQHLYKQWDRTARIDVYRLSSSIEALEGRPVESLFFVQDSSAGSILLGVGDDLASGRAFYEDTVYGLGYVLGRREKALLIGLGGAPDVLTALYYDTGHITGVDINGATIGMSRGPFRDFLGAPYDRPNVEIHQMDGRTYLRGSDEKYDLIQMSGVDTKSVFAAGSLSVNENYIYTREAFADILDHLEPDGLLAVNRFSDRDAFRLTTTALTALEELGVERPKRHLFVVKQGYQWRGLLMKRSEFTPAEVRRLNAWARSKKTAPEVSIPAYDWIGVPIRKRITVMYSPPPVPVATRPYFEALADGSVHEYVEAQETDLRPPTDDRPFFFFFVRPAIALAAAMPWAEEGDLASTRTLQAIHTLLLQLGTVSAAFILLPLIVARRRGLRAPGAGRAILYFICLGAGFMFAEIGLIQRFVLLLGHQSYAVTVVLLGLLLGAAAGSHFSQRLSVTERGPLATALGCVVAILLAYAFGLDLVFGVLAKSAFEVRLGVALGLLIALGFAVGIPFPTALRALEGSRVPFIAWAVAVNGFASVMASTLSLEIAMLIGLRTLLLLGTALYVLAIWLSPAGRRIVASGD